MSNQPPIEVPQGAIRFNTDSQKMEFFAQDRWYEMATHDVVFDGGSGRGLIFRGDGSGNNIDVINIETAGNATDFGHDHYDSDSVGAVGDRTRAIVVGGGSPFTNEMQFFTISINSAGTDFGDLTRSHRQVGRAINSTRSCMAGGFASPGSTASEIIDYVTTQSTGNAQDFGDLAASGEQEMASSPTRAVSMGGYGGSPAARYTSSQVLTTHTLGNSFIFTDIDRPRNDTFGVSNSVRGVFLGGGQNSPLPDQTDECNYITFSTLGEFVEFGQLTNRSQSHSGVSNSTRAVKTNGYNGAPANATTAQMDYFSIATGGLAVDFGDATYTGTASAAISNAHGGL